MNRASRVVVLGTALAAACSEPEIVQGTQLNLDRPVDISFACYGQKLNSLGEVVTTAQPAAACEARSPQVTPDPAPPSDLALAWYGFILQSAQGTVAVARWPAVGADKLANGDFEVLDVDPLTPGKNAISIGEDPIAIVSDRSGCFQVTANAGSCDLSSLEVSGAVDLAPSTPTVVNRIEVKKGTTPFRVRPAAMVAEPNATTPVPDACPATPTGLVYVAYPSCGLVAAVDLASGQIVSGIQFDSAGIASVVDGASVTCNGGALENFNQCDGDRALPGATRPVALDLEFDTRVDLTKPAETRRLAIGADNRASVTVVDLDASFRPLAQAPLQVPLQNTTGDLGVTTLSLSPQIGMGGFAEVGPESKDEMSALQEQYVYAVATDDTVRVVDVLNTGPGSLAKECDTQIDPRFLRGLGAAALQCLPVGDPNTPRRPLARGPGIQLPDDVVPTSVAIVKGLASLPPGEMNVPRVPSPSLVIGYLAVITGANGTSYVVNVDDDAAPDAFSAANPFRTAPTIVMPHQLRDSVQNRGGEPPVTGTCDVGNPGLAEGGLNAGGPRASAPQSNAAAGAPGVISTSKALGLPLLRQVECFIPDNPDPAAPEPVLKPVSEVQFTSAQLPFRDRVFPDLGALRNEQWTLTWEGALSVGATESVDGPVTRSAQMQVDQSGMFLLDKARPFCDAGVEPYDVVQFRGCDPANANTDCPSGYVCYVHPDSQRASGACMLRNEAERLSNACRDFLVTLQHYTVAPDRRDRTSVPPELDDLVYSDRLVLMPRKRVLRTSPVGGCDLAAPPPTPPQVTECEELADYAVQLASESNPIDKTLTDPRTWECRADDTRRPLAAGRGRCVLTCGFHSPDFDGQNRDADCDANTICQGAMPGVRGICMEGVVPPQSCVNGPQRYEVHAGEAFVLVGSRSGYVHPFIKALQDTPGRTDPVGACTRDPSDSARLQVSRIPLTAPACDATADPITGKSGAVFEPNPCALTVDHTENRPNYLPISPACQLPPPPAPGEPDTRVTMVTRTASAIKLRNRSMTLTMVDPVYPGDQTCILDRAGGRTDIPIVFPNYQLLFNSGGGFLPQTLSGIGPGSVIGPSYPIKVVRGPGNSIWVVDSGDFLTNSPQRSPTLGGVFRVDPVFMDQFHLLL